MHHIIRQSVEFWLKLRYEFCFNPEVLFKQVMFNGIQLRYEFCFNAEVSLKQVVFRGKSVNVS